MEICDPFSQKLQYLKPGHPATGMQGQAPGSRKFPETGRKMTGEGILLIQNEDC
jgi:hypothetical protein